ncbi:MAG: hypothetical protein GXP25_08180 [Planctomycetes bacterium]|nr:hypothetical protein [Planctomycetota bacterium]
MNRKTVCLLLACFLVVACGCATERIRATKAVSNLERVTTPDAMKFYPSVSRDGKKLAFSAKERGFSRVKPNYDIWVMDTQNTQSRIQITDHPADDLRPSWSGDRVTLLFDSKRLGKRTIWEKKANGLGGVQQITADVKTNDWDAEVSIDGNIAFVSEPDNLGYGLLRVLTLFAWDERRVVVCDPEGKRLCRIRGTHLSWSPDGEFLAISSNRARTFFDWLFSNPNNDIWIFRPDGSCLTRLTKHPANDIEPCWSPDGKMICFATNRAMKFLEWNNYDLWIMDSDGSGGLTQLTFGGRHEGHPSWGADGYIYFHSNWDSRGQENWDIWRMKPIMGRAGVPEEELRVDASSPIPKDLQKEIIDVRLGGTGAQPSRPMRVINPITDK